MHTPDTLGVNDGIHDAEGVAKVIALDDETYVPRLENFNARQRSKLSCISSHSQSSIAIVNLGRIKGNIGNQNYPIPDGN